MTLTVEATYENGVLRLAAPLPLVNQSKVRVIVQAENIAPAIPTNDDSPPVARGSGKGLDSQPLAITAEDVMVNLVLNVPPSERSRTVTVVWGKPILPKPYVIDESDLTPE